MSRSNKVIISILFASTVVFGTIPHASGQDQVEVPSWEVGWETNMAGVYELQLSGDDDIMDSVEFFVANERMVDLNLEITIEWDVSDESDLSLIHI